MHTEVAALLDYLLAESYARGTDLSYRFRIPYGPSKPEDGQDPTVEFVVELAIYYDGELVDERDPEPNSFKITGPTKIRH